MIFEKLKFSQVVKNSPAFFVARRLLRSSQDATTGPILSWIQLKLTHYFFKI
jgi:hypothetical protein